MFGNKYNFMGFDYYQGGIYDITFGEKGTQSNLPIVENFDWRNRHNANLEPQPGENHPYHDGSIGWLTEPKNQKCNHCWVFAPLHATEAMVNLYYNQQIDIDLSEQELASCVDINDNCDGGYAYQSLDYLKNNGVVNEDCFEYDPYANYVPYIPPSAVNVPCNDDLNCGDPFASKISGSEVIDNNEFHLKKAIIEKGPIICLFELWWHYMMIAGFGKLQSGDVVYTDESGLQEPIIINDGGDGGNLIGQTYWIVKNSWGASWGVNGFGKIYLPITLQNDVYKIAEFIERENIKTPIIANDFTDEDIACLDYDNDGYYNWGISEEKPETCPEGCLNLEDSNDDNPRIGPFDEDYYSVPVAPLMEVNNENGKVIPNNSFYSFYDDINVNDQITLTFKIENNGDAKLNLRPNNLGTTVTISEDYDGEDFEVSYPGDFTTEIAMEGGSTTFYITFKLTPPIDEAKKAEISIHVNEVDMDVYKFNLVFAECPEELADDEVIREDQSWNGIVLKFGDVYVEAGATLTVRGEVAFVSGASLIVEPGGKVYVDGGVLTSLCGNLWQGVDVWGNKYLTQYLEENRGYIKLMNGGKISYADVGIETIKKDDGRPDLTTSGGIVVMNNGIIENCKTGVRFYPYTNFWPDSQHPSPNCSGFTEAHFINDKNSAPEKQLFLEEVNGIDIKGCTFENSVPPNVFKQHIGIYSDKSGFTVSYKNLTPVYPPVDILKSSFKNFDYGIYAVNTPAIGRPYICNSVFEDNQKGIYMSMVDYPVIIQNEFNVRKRFSFFPESVEMIGLYIEDQSNGYVVEENEFYTELHSSKLETVKCGGIHLTNTGGSPNEIYNNQFNDLSVGIIAAGSNQDGNGVGLCIKCNDFTRCFNDVYITYEGGTGYLGIATKQGDVAPVPPGEEYSSRYAAGNTFSKTDIENPDNYNYANLDGCNPVIYTYHGNYDAGRYKLRPEPVFPRPPSQQIDLNKDDNVWYNSKSEACPSNYNGGGIDLMASNSTYSSELVSVNAYEDTLSIFVDGGDTESLTWDVNMSTPPEAVEVRQALLNDSPYLSDTVMKAAIAKEDVLPNAMVRDVLVANPQSAKSTEVLQFLDNRSDTMPGYMMDQVMQGQNIVGAKELLEQNLAGHKTKKGKALKKLMHYYLADTTDFEASNDSIISLLATDNELQSRYKLSLRYLGLKDSAGAYSTFYGIPSEFDLNNEQENEYDLYEDLLDLRWQMIADTTMPDSLTIAALFDIEAHYNTAPGVHARNMLIGLGELEYDEPVYFPEFNKATPIWRRSFKHNQGASTLKVFPNPAGSYFIAEYKLYETLGTNMLVLTDLNGHNILVINIQKKQNQIVIPTSGIKPGVYILQLINGSKVQESVKIAIVN